MNLTIDQINKIYRLSFPEINKYESVRVAKGIGLESSSDCLRSSLWLADKITRNILNQGTWSGEFIYYFRRSYGLERITQLPDVIPTEATLRSIILSLVEEIPNTVSADMSVFIHRYKLDK